MRVVSADAETGERATQRATRGEKPRLRSPRERLAPTAGRSDARSGDRAAWSRLCRMRPSCPTRRARLAGVPDNGGRRRHGGRVLLPRLCRARIRQQRVTRTQARGHVVASLRNLVPDGPRARTSPAKKIPSPATYAPITCDPRLVSPRACSVALISDVDAGRKRGLAFELAGRDAQVTLLERAPTLCAGCSYGNAGLISGFRERRRTPTSPKRRERVA
jgi:hypothetical protein